MRHTAAPSDQRPAKRTTVITQRPNLFSNQGLVDSKALTKAATIPTDLITLIYLKHITKELDTIFERTEIILSYFFVKDKLQFHLKQSTVETEQ